eukprot:Nitzschia sp. Nitz4//scaffold153_size53422//29133//31264//NITZ4_006764-RA/size53422-augustus-gene-0.42-mRNA-1//1//CDS//3329537271//5269//frame0
MADTMSDIDQPRRKKGSFSLNDLFIVFFGVCFTVSFSLNVMHFWTHDTMTQPSSALHESIAKFENGGIAIGTQDSNHQQPSPIQLAELDCSAYGGPSKELASEVVYWQDIPSDSTWVSPLKDPNNRKFLTFEPDGGGWNNIRMAMESVFGLAMAMGRTLVMPPEKKMYLLGKTDNKQKKHFSFVDFYPIEEMAKDNAGFDVISMKEYLETQAMTGKLRNKETGLVEFPPGNRTDWDGIDQREYDELRGYLRNVTNTPLWTPGSCLPTFPASGDHKDVEHLQHLAFNASKNKRKGYPAAVDDPNTQTRMEDVLAGRTKLCVYDEEMQNAGTVHFQCNHKLKIRMLVHFYAFLFFEDWREDLLMKRFIRDHVRYIDQIQCAAARVIAGVREHARKKDPIGNPDGIFDSFHIRRGDFQFKATRIPASEIYENSKDELTEHSTIFIATDERDKSFFNDLAKHYDLLFLDDFSKELEGVNTNFLGMIDQVVASKGRIFFGCWFSTFTGFITRIRGYHSQNEHAPGFRKGILPTTFYYATPDRKMEMQTYEPLRGGFFNREFPISWRDIDKGIGIMGD